MLGYKDRSAVLDLMYASKICPGNNGMFMPTIVMDGRIVGIWKHTLKKGKVAVAADPFTALIDAESSAFTTAVSHYGRFLDISVILS